MERKAKSLTMTSSTTRHSSEGWIFCDPTINCIELLKGSIYVIGHNTHHLRHYQDARLFLLKPLSYSGTLAKHRYVI